MDRRASVSIPCNSPRNPDWMFLSRVLGRQVSPAEGMDDERAGKHLRDLLFEAHASRGDELFAALLDLREDETANARDLPGLRKRLFDAMFFSKRDALGRPTRETRYCPGERYLSDVGKDLVDRSIANERYALQARDRETSLAIGGIPVPKVAPLKDTDRLPFGRYQDRTLRDVPAGYLDHIRSQDWIEKYPEVVAYIDGARKALDKELDLEPDPDRPADRDRERESYEPAASGPGFDD